MKSQTAMALAEKAREARLLVFRALHEAGGAGHYGGCLSEIEILTVLYNGILRIDPQHPKWKERDYFILSKGHGAVGMAAVLSKAGFFAEDILATYKRLGSTLGYHTTAKMPGIEHPTGSLGHGLSVSVGVAFANNIQRRQSRVFTLLGDGECNEGSVWEAAMSASKYKLDRLVAIIDRNYLSMESRTEEGMPLEPFEDKWRSFGWTPKTVDGHDVEALWRALSDVPFEKDRPSVLIAQTVKGKGVSFTENAAQWHAGVMTEREYSDGLKELSQ